VTLTFDLKPENLLPQFTYSCPWSYLH